MAKKKNEYVQPKAAVEVGPEGREQKGEGQKAPKSSGFVTTEGNTIDKVQVFPDREGNIKVQVEYGKLNPAGKNAEERRAGMHKQVSRALTPEQSKEYQRLYAEDASKAKEYAVKTAYPMHYDDKAFHQKDTVVNDRHVNYITLEKISEDSLVLNHLRNSGYDVDSMKSEDKRALLDSLSPDERKAALVGKEGLVGRWQLSFGEKGNKENRFYGVLNKEELANIRHRAEVTLDEKGQVTAVGKPLSMADIAAKFENRVLSQRQNMSEKVEKAEKVDWSKYKFPDGVQVTGLRYAPVKDNPDRVWMNGKVNGMNVFSMLSKNETTAVKNKMATLEQAAAANREFYKKVMNVVGPVQGQSQGQGVTEDAAVKAVVARASESSARSFSPEQVKTLNDFAEAQGADTSEAREKVFSDVFSKAKEILDKDGVPEGWQKDASDELKDLSQGVVRDLQQGIHR